MIHLVTIGKNRNYGKGTIFTMCGDNVSASGGPLIFFKVWLSLVYRLLFIVDS